jgi:hypothetical protein
MVEMFNAVMLGADGNRYGNAQFAAGGINLTVDAPQRNHYTKDLGRRAGAVLFDVRSACGGSRHVTVPAASIECVCRSGFL